ncbi:MAG: hypothetical protein WCW26_05580 [Candidatus Buchananbacteria bacterium]
MIKNWKLAVGLAAGLWAIMFIGVSAFMVMPISVLWQKILELILSVVGSFILARFYFKKNPGEIKDGLILGIFWLLAGTVLDLLITIFYVKASGTYLDGLKSFYGMWSLWVSFVLTVVTVAITAKITHGGILIKKPTPQVPMPPTSPKI